MHTQNNRLKAAGEPNDSLVQSPGPGGSHGDVDIDARLEADPVTTHVMETVRKLSDEKAATIPALPCDSSKLNIHFYEQDQNLKRKFDVINENIHHEEPRKGAKIVHDIEKCDSVIVRRPLLWSALTAATADVVGIEAFVALI
ncbi:hypothetical protein HDU76_007485 [Blyttiomyces sp. JEL0837]|nr:hypothetical protein HDU76_007485 [Blyttiomyces sp. JEL0837]